MPDKYKYLVGPWSQEIVKSYNQLIKSEIPNFSILKEFVAIALQADINCVTIAKWLQGSGMPFNQYDDKGNHVLLGQAKIKGCPELVEVLFKIPILTTCDLEEALKSAEHYKQIQEKPITWEEIRNLVQDGGNKLWEYTEETIAYMQKLKWTLLPGILFEGSLILTKLSPYMGTLYYELCTLIDSGDYSDMIFGSSGNDTCPALGDICALDQDFSDYS